jgi:hypothetical protein
MTQVRLKGALLADNNGGELSFCRGGVGWVGSIPLFTSKGAAVLGLLRPLIIELAPFSAPSRTCWRSIVASLGVARFKVAPTETEYKLLSFSIKVHPCLSMLLGAHYSRRKVTRTDYCVKPVTLRRTAQ